jgi:hypothetical protein
VAIGWQFSCSRLYLSIEHPADGREVKPLAALGDGGGDDRSQPRPCALVAHEAFADREGRLAPAPILAVKSRHGAAPLRLGQLVVTRNPARRSIGIAASILPIASAVRCTATWCTVTGTPSARAAAGISPPSLRAWRTRRLASFAGHHQTATAVRSYPAM